MSHKSPQRVEKIAKSTTGDPMGTQGVWYVASKKTPEGSSTEIMAMLPRLSQSMKDVFGTVDNLGKKVEGSVKILKDRMNEVFKGEGVQRKKDYEHLEEKCAQK